MHPYMTWEIVRQQQREMRTRARAAARAKHPSAAAVPLPSALRHGAAHTLRRMADQLEPTC